MDLVLPAYGHYQHFRITSPAPWVLQVLIDRPDAYNTFTGSMWRDFGRIMRQASVDDECRVVVLSATDCAGFSAGIDLKEASQEDAFRGVTGEDPARRAAKIRRYIEEFQQQISAAETCEKPVICALFGTSYGIAVDIACCCSLRLCSQDAVFAVKEIDVGIAADLGTLTRLPKIVGSSGWAQYVCLTGSPFKAEEALGQGFVTEVLPSREEALDRAVRVAGLIAGKSPVASTAVKAIMNHARDHTIAQSLHYTGVWNAAALQTEDVSKAIMTFKSKQVPRFSKL